jgi:hypothetical protein
LAIYKDIVHLPILESRPKLGGDSERFAEAAMSTEPGQSEVERLKKLIDGMREDVRKAIYPEGWGFGKSWEEMLARVKSHVSGDPSWEKDDFAQRTWNAGWAAGQRGMAEKAAQLAESEPCPDYMMAKRIRSLAVAEPQPAIGTINLPSNPHPEITEAVTKAVQDYGPTLQRLGAVEPPQDKLREALQAIVDDARACLERNR